jgi:molecular chaperone DnaK
MSENAFPKKPAGAGDDFGFDVPPLPAEFEQAKSGPAPFATAFGTSPQAPPVDAYGSSSGEEVARIDQEILGRVLEARGIKVGEVPDLAPLKKGLVGIDLGASVAAVARFNEDGKHEVVPNEDNDMLTPALVFLDEDGEKLVGKAARRLAPSAPDRAFSEVKLALGAPDKPDAEALASYVVSRLLDDVLRVTGARPTHAAVAAPAWFTEDQRAALGRAVLKAGVAVVGVTDEALASAVPYSLRLEDLNPRTAAVFDLGHAALGCALVRCARGDIEVLASEARLDLGARRWDDLIVEEGAARFKQQYGFDPREDKGAELDLRLRAEDAKKALTARSAFTLVVQARGKVMKVGFSRPLFETAATVLVTEARAHLEKVRQAAGVGSWKKVDALIVTGGASRMPMIRRMLLDLTGLQAERGMNPDEGVAIGALYWGLFARWREGGRGY